MAIGEDGNLYSWGYNAYGQLGLGNKTNYNTPQLVTLPNNIKPKTIALGQDHSMMMDN